MVNLSKNPAARQPLPQIPVGPPPMMLSPQDAMIGMHAHHQVSMGQQVKTTLSATYVTGLSFIAQCQISMWLGLHCRPLAGAA